MEARWLLYAGADQNNQQFAIEEPVLEEQSLRWWVYQANDLLHYSYETLLKYSLDTLEDYPAGIALNTLIAELVSALSEADRNWPPTWRDFLASQPAQNANGDSPNSERILVEAIAPTSGPNHKTTPEAAWAALRLLAVVANRAQSESAVIGTALGHLDREGFRSLVTEMSFLNASEDQPFPRTVARIIEERVLKRHLWVAHRKFRYQNDYTFLIEADDGRVRLRAESGPVLTNPRLAPAITFLEDIHLNRCQWRNSPGKSPSRGAMKLYEYYGKSGFHTCIVTTFGLDFDAYENVIFSRARGAGCHNNLLIADGRMLSLALDGNSSLPRHAGRLYSVTGAAAKGVFHPKVTLQLGRSGGRLIVSSANVTSAGLAGNLARLRLRPTRRVEYVYP